MHASKNNALYLGVKVFSTKVLIEENNNNILRLILHGDGTTILRGQPCHAKVLRIEVIYKA